MENKIEEMFAEAIGPVLKKLREIKDSTSERRSVLDDEMSQSNPAQILNSVRECGMSFGHALNHVMEGYVRSDRGRITLEEELKQFHASYEKEGRDHHHDQRSTRTWYNHMIHPPHFIKLNSVDEWEPIMGA